MIAYAGSGGVMFVPEKIDRKRPKSEVIKTVPIRKANDNAATSLLQK